MEIEKLVEEIIFIPQVEIPQEFSEKSFTDQIRELVDRTTKANKRSEKALIEIGQTVNNTGASKEA